MDNGFKFLRHRFAENAFYNYKKQSAAVKSGKREQIDNTDVDGYKRKNEDDTGIICAAYGVARRFGNDSYSAYRSRKVL